MIRSGNSRSTWALKGSRRGIVGHLGRTRRAIKDHVGHSSTLDTQALHRHLDIWALKACWNLKGILALGHSNGTWTLRHSRDMGTQCTLFRRHGKYGFRVELHNMMTWLSEPETFFRKICFCLRYYVS